MDFRRAEFNLFRESAQQNNLGGCLGYQRPRKVISPQKITCSKHKTVLSYCKKTSMGGQGMPT